MPAISRPKIDEHHDRRDEAAAPGAAALHRDGRAGAWWSGRRRLVEDAAELRGERLALGAPRRAARPPAVLALVLGPLGLGVGGVGRGLEPRDLDVLGRLPGGLVALVALLPAGSGRRRGAPAETGQRVFADLPPERVVLRHTTSPPDREARVNQGSTGIYRDSTGAEERRERSRPPSARRPP